MAAPVVLVACDKFKGTLVAEEVAARIAAGVRAEAPQATVRSLLVADGGDGTIEAALAAGYSPRTVTVAGPVGKPRPAWYAVKGSTAVVELAETCGIVHLPRGELAPLTATSRGVGEAMREALDDGCEELVLGIGGSASTDGGTGMLSALGARFLDAEGQEIPDGAGGLALLERVDLSGLHPRLAQVRLVVACDVNNPLLGRQGAAAVFGPQKGVTEQLRPQVDAGLTRLADLLAAATGRDVRDQPGAGAAGGVGYAALQVLGARMRPGVELVLELAGFAEQAAGADLVVTGEGSLDEQSLMGKTPMGVADAAGRLGIPVVAVCGRSQLAPGQAEARGIRRVYALTQIEPSTARCLAEAGPLLQELAGIVTRDLVQRRL
ncbi:glycerate kinase [Arsenicicoccus sp. oral taxon 190]|uniref:glycerate kinase n=1 Tax=Arsenicicoccus sp. oral taxon 190 TaxID=1658671 RepID=UPI00067A1802|nr:glycerate kinase [Arsenicicoccus sp. oral taxon 190]AKT50445.1 glycerate kinase [Arsenicicoccus sp. oral taxon 190]